MDLRAEAADIIPVDAERLERIRDVLARISLREFNPETDLFPITGDDAFSAFEDTISLFARQLNATVAESEAAIAALEATRLDLEEKLQTIERQQKAIAELSTPVLELVDQVVTLPILGEIDAERSRLMTDALLGAITKANVRCAIVDVTGVPVIDTNTADSLIRMVASARMLGAYCVVTGISPSVALTLSEIGVEISGIRTLGTLRDGLRECIRHMRDGENTRAKRAVARS